MTDHRPSRAENRAYMEGEILRLGRQQLTSRGPAQVSLREIARDLGVASSAVYRYIADRDQLLTLLVVDAYTELADAVVPDEETLSEKDFRAQVSSFAHGMRDWALANPARWGLIYGTPVPGYAAPAEITTGPGTRLIATLARIFASSASGTPEPEGMYRPFLREAGDELGVAAEPAQLADAVEAWCAIVGTISMEVFGQLGPEVGQIGELVLARTVARLTAPPGYS